MDKKQIAWLGTGVMGLAMAKHILNAGHSLSIYTRTKSKAQELLDMGATWANSPKEAAQNADIVFSIVGFPSDVEEVILGENGALQGLKAGGIICDMTTSCPDLAVRIADAAKEKNCFGADAPVTGGDVGAKNGNLSIFVGSDAEVYEKLLPVLECMGKTIMYCGKAGTGQKAKLANQIAIAGVMFSTCESLLFAKEAGVDMEQWLKTISTGAATSAAMVNLGPRIIKGDFEPGFFVEHFLKDLGLCLEQCRRMNLVLPGVVAAEQAYRILVAQGCAKKGTQILIKGLANLSAKKWD